VGKIATIGSFQKATTKSFSITPPKFVLSTKKVEAGSHVVEEYRAPPSISNSLTTTPKATPSKSRGQNEEKEKTPHSSAKKPKTQIQNSPSNSKTTPNSMKSRPAQDEWSSPQERKSMGNGTSTMVNTDAETDTFWDEDMSIEMVTDVGDGNVDEEVRSLSNFSCSLSLTMVSQISAAAQAFVTLHTRKIQNYKRLLERTQTSSAAQLHALQAQLRILRENGGLNGGSAGGFHALPPAYEDLCVCGGKKQRGYWSGYRDDCDEDGGDLTKALKGNGKGVFSENEVRKALRTLGRDERMRL